MARLRDAVRPALSTSTLRRVQLGVGANSLASWGLNVALGIYAFDVGGAAAVGTAALARMIPAGLAAPLAGLAADRWSRRDVLLVAGILGGISLALIAGAVRAGLPFAVVLVLAAAFTALTTVQHPALAALLPDLAQTPLQLAAANSVANGVENVAYLVGSLVAGLVYAAAGAAAAFVLIALVALVAALAWAGVARDPVPDHRLAAAEAPLHELTLGLRAVLAEPPLRVLVGTMSLATLVEGAVDVLLVVTALSLLDMGSSGVGTLNACWGLGGVLGGAAALSLLGVGRVSAGIVLGGLAAGIPLIVIGIAPGVAVAATMLAIVGVGYSLIEIAGHTLVQRLTSDEVLGRAFAVLESSYWVTTGVGAMLCPLLISLVGARGALIVVGLCLPATVALRRHALTVFEDAAPVPEQEFAMLRRLALFAPVPLATVENLSRRVERLPVAGGDVLFRAGDDGDRFYVVASGELLVTRDGIEISRAAPGGFVGEIALLRDVPRTATVTVAESGVLFALEREDFIGTITGNVRSSQAADAVITARS
ncbi:MAG TPA: cyclic nucleotide-binding domain-containing protein [Solirubrobacteraceae bacterium]